MIAGRIRDRGSGTSKCSGRSDMVGTDFSVPLLIFINVKFKDLCYSIVVFHEIIVHGVLIFTIFMTVSLVCSECYVAVVLRDQAYRCCKRDCVLRRANF